ncbi:MAG: ABC1 kinase family protein [Bdellovibrio sp.]
MSLLSTGRRLGRTIKNAGRLRTIVSVFAKHGFSNVAERVKLGRFLIERLSAADNIDQLSVPERIRMSFEELGPTFVKLGQLLATRPDLVPEDWVQEFSKLHDQVQSVPFRLLEDVLASELGPDWRKNFLEVNPEPLGAASIAQVHRARLVDGTPVVLKIQRPGILQKIKDDLNVLYFLAELLHAYVPETHAFNPIGVVDEYFKTLDLETNFVVEANNIRRFTENFKTDPDVKIPKVYLELTTERLLVMELLDGVPLSSDVAMKQPGVDADALIRKGLRVYLKMVFQDGLFHGDLHAGNFFILPDNKIGLIDFGVVGRLNSKTQSSIASMLVALAREDYERLAYEYIDLAPFTDQIQADLFARDLRNLIAPFYGLTLKNVNMGKVLLGSSAIAARHHLAVPTELMLFFKSLVTIEAMGRRIQEDFDFLAYSLQFAGELIKTQYEPSKAMDEIARVARDSQHLLRDLPRQLHFYLRKVNSPRYSFRINVENLDELKKGVETSFNLLFLGIVIGSLVVSSSILAANHPEGSIPTLATVGYSLAAVLGFFAFINFIKK